MAKKKKLGSRHSVGQIVSVWKELEMMLSADQSCDKVFPDGAGEQEIMDTENLIGLRLPTDVRESFLLHNGSNRIWIGEELGYLMPLDRPMHLSKRASMAYATVNQSWSILNHNLDNGIFDDPGFSSNPVGPVRSEHWIQEWIPLTYNECGDHLMLDMRPKKGGRKGQIIVWDHEVGATRVIASDFLELLAQVRDDLKSGLLIYDSAAAVIKPLR